MSDVSARVPDLAETVGAHLVAHPGVCDGTDATRALSELSALAARAEEAEETARIMTSANETSMRIADDLAGDVEAAEARAEKAERTISRVWAILGDPSYKGLAGRSIFDLVQTAVDLAARAEGFPTRCDCPSPEMSLCDLPPGHDGPHVYVDGTKWEQKPGDVPCHDPDYSPAYQDEYQRLWHETAARAEEWRTIRNRDVALADGDRDRWRKRADTLEEALQRMAYPQLSDAAMFGSWEDIGPACQQIAIDALASVPPAPENTS